MNLRGLAGQAGELSPLYHILVLPCYAYIPDHSLQCSGRPLSSGVPVAVAAKMMEHSVTMFTETYADLLVEATEDAARQSDEWLARQ